MFNRTHRQTGEVVTGTWDQVCDLDKRLWTDPERVEPAKGFTYLAIIQVRSDALLGRGVTASQYIQSQRDLVNLYV